MNAPVEFDDPTKLNWWAAALKGERRPINANEPMTGYYRARSKNKQTGEERLFAVAYWWHNGNCFCKVDGGATLQGEKHQRMLEAWPHVSKEPVQYDVYNSVIAGKPWPDQHVAPKAAPAEPSDSMPLDEGRQVTAIAPAAGAAPPSAERTTEVDTSPQAVLRREIDTLIGGMECYVKKDAKGELVFLIESDAANGAAQSLRAQFLAESNKAKKAREEANRPHNEAIRKNGMIWTPLESLAKINADALRDGPMREWERHKRDQQAAAAKATQAAGAPIASNAPAPAAKIKGAVGRSARVEEIKITVIHDFDQVYAHFRDNEQVKAILQGLSNAAVRAGIEVPGTTSTTDVSIK